MNNLKAQKNNKLSSVWKGSSSTAQLVRSQIASRWGEKAAEEYDPQKNCFTYTGWKQRGYQVKRGAKALESVTFIEVPDNPEENREDQEMVTIPKPVHLFYKKQVKKLEEGKN